DINQIYNVDLTYDEGYESNEETKKENTCTYEGCNSSIGEVYQFNMIDTTEICLYESY
ncbi:hypothetical protein DFQ30_002364, partial [Apophysomyces sp. BC1015]